MFPLLFHLIPATLTPLYALWKCQAWRESNIHCHNYFNEREWRRCFSAICQQTAVMAQAGLYSLTNYSSVLNTEFSITSSRSTAFIIFPGSLWSLQITAPKLLMNFVVLQLKPPVCYLLLTCIPHTQRGPMGGTSACATPWGGNPISSEMLRVLWIYFIYFSQSSYI